MVVYLSEPEVLKEFIEGLKRSASAAHALAHYQQNPGFLKIRDNLELIIVAGTELATSKAMPRQRVLEELDTRKLNLPKDLNGN